jgi:Arc/MetJ-type ribon-helix-helix transcriptional regulator
MVRTQIQLTEDQARRLQLVAAQRHVSMAELVREGVEEVLRKHDSERQEKQRRAREVIGRYRSGQHDISTRHDDYLADALLDELNESRPS